MVLSRSASPCVSGLDFVFMRFLLAYAVSVSGPGWLACRSGTGRGPLVANGAGAGAAPGNAVHAPVDAEDTSAAYFASAPRVSRARAGCHSIARRDRSAVVAIVRA